MKKTLLTLFVVLGSLVFSQTDDHTIDSLNAIVNSNVQDSSKLRALSELNWIYTISNPIKSKEIAYQEIKISQNLPDIFKAQAYNDLAISFFKLYELDSALVYNTKALKIRKAHGDKFLIASSLSKIGGVHTELANYKEALDATLEAVKIYEAINDKAKLGLIYTNIAALYEKINQQDMVKFYCEKAIKLCKEVGDEYGLATVQTALASYYIKTNQQKIAFLLMDDVIKIYLKYEDSLSLAAVYNNIGYMYRLIGKNKEGKEYYLKAYDVAIKIGDVNGALIYKHNLSNIMMMDGDYKEAEKLTQEILDNTSPENSNQLLLSYRLMANIKAYLGKGRESEEYQDKFVTLKDSLFSTENAGAMARLQTLYETEKQSLEIENLEKDKLIQEEQIRKRNSTIIGFGIGLVLAIALIIVVLKSYRANQRANALIVQQKQFVEIQRDKLQTQNVIIEEKKQEILDSINYARRIQEAILPPDEDIVKAFPESFVLYKPKDIVAGDFYWMYEEEDLETSENESIISYVNNTVLIAAADCTGHGVPGAFMSLLGKENLDKSLNVSASPGGILAELNRNIKRALQQNKKEDATRDGMDIALIKVQGNKVAYSGANRPLWIKRLNSEVLEEIKATKAAIGGFTPDDQVFDEHEVYLEKGDTVYMFTDGYPDQFGGEKQKKLTTKRMREIVLEISSKNMLAQKQYLDAFISDWSTDTEQVDDILVMGIRI